MNTNRFIFTLILILTIAAAGCGKKQQNTIYSTTEKDIISEYNAQLFAAANPNPERSDYLLGPGDLMEIRVLEAERLDTTTRISSRGFISIPLLDEIRVQGLTASEAEQLIEDKYKEKYIKDPHVSIFVKEHFSQRVTVVGQVRNPGTYDYPSRQRLLDAIALAGGLTDKASQVVQVRRMSNASTGSDQTVVVNLEELIGQGKTNLNISINGGDVIFVPEAGSFFVDGAVRKPGEYFIKQSVSLKEAVITAGGYQSYADTDEILVLRPNGDGQREEIKIDVDRKSQSAEEFYVQDRDIIVIGESFWGKMFHGAGINLGVPGLGFSLRNSD